MQKTNLFTLPGILLALSFLYFGQGCASSNTMAEENARNIISKGNPPPASIDSLYKIRTGDEIEILVWGHPNFNTTTSVSSMGTIAVPLIGEIEASGLTHSQLKNKLAREMAVYIREDINLTLSVRSMDQMLVSVFGMVTRPDNYPVVNETSIFKILSVAGGPTEEANIRSVKVYRKNSDPHYEVLDLTSYLDSGQMNSASTNIYPGDIVYVPRKENAVREMSNFLRDVVLLFGIFRVVN